MRKLSRLLCLLTVSATSVQTHADSSGSTRVVDPNQHACTSTSRNACREKSEYVLKELDLKPGDVVVDIGAGDGWWAEKMAKAVGPKGAIHAAEIDPQFVDELKEKFADIPQIKPYLCPMEGTALPDNFCDLVFLSKTYHHLDDHVRYLRHLHKVVKPTGRICVIERHAGLLTGPAKEHALSPGILMRQAEKAGWIPVRYELITGTYHFMAIFVQKDLFPPPPQRRRG